MMVKDNFDEDWTHRSPSTEQIEDYLRERIREGKQLSAEAYAWDAFLHFEKSENLTVFRDIAARVMDE